MEGRAGTDFLLSIVMGLLWITAISSYGAATQLVGRFGTTIAYPTFGAFTILFANVLGWLAGEVTSQVLRYLWIGIVLMLSSVGILALAYYGR